MTSSRVLRSRAAILISSSSLFGTGCLSSCPGNWVLAEPVPGPRWWQICRHRAATAASLAIWMRFSVHSGARDPAGRGRHGLPGEDATQLGCDSVWVLVKRRFKIASLGQG